MLTAEARARASAWALASRARAWTLAYSGMAMAARIPMMATTIINSMSVKPRWLPSGLRCLCQNFVMDSASIVPDEMLVPRPGWTSMRAGAVSAKLHIVCHASGSRRWRWKDLIVWEGLRVIDGRPDSVDPPTPASPRKTAITRGGFTPHPRDRLAVAVLRSRPYGSETVVPSPLLV